MRRTPSGLILSFAVVLVYGAVAALLYFGAMATLPSQETEPQPLQVNDVTVRSLCSSCHLFPEPTILPRGAWWKIHHRMAKVPGFPGTLLPADSLIAWFEEHAPEKIELPQEHHAPELEPLRWRRRAFATNYTETYPFIANIQLVDLYGDARLELVASEISHGLVVVGEPYAATLNLERIGWVPNPAHISPVDLDQDGLLDLVVSNLGSLPPIDHELGSVDWLRRNADGSFERVILFEGLGRTADARPQDFDGDGDLDLTLGEFGYQKTGQVGVLENQAPPGAAPRYALHQLDPRHGAIHTEVTDLNHDGRPDIVVLLAQEHEMVVAYLNQGDLTFEVQQLYRAPHPAWGHSGMELIDLDGDDDLDILLSNGDMFDDPSLKPYHGVQWLEQTAPLSFTPHPLVRMYAAHRAAAGDLDGDGDLDIVACSFMPEPIFEEARETGLRFQSVIWIEQTAPGEFVPHPLEQDRPHHATLTLGDYDLDGDVDLVVGNASFNVGAAPDSAWALELWENLGRARGEAP